MEDVIHWKILNPCSILMKELQYLVEHVTVKTNHVFHY